LSAFNAHSTLLLEDELAANIETQSQAHLPSSLDWRLRVLEIPLPNVGLLLRREARSLVPDPDANGASRLI
jgi:hypothetical protein